MEGDILRSGRALRGGGQRVALLLLQRTVSQGTSIYSRVVSSFKTVGEKQITTKKKEEKLGQ